MTDHRLIAHLLRRAGFGASRSEIEQYAALGFEGAVERLVSYENVDNSALDAELAARAYDLSTLTGCQMWWLHRMLRTARPLEEKLTLFWHGHFASSNDKVQKPPYMLMQNQLFRQNALGRFDDLVLRVTQDPAMLVFLDGKDNGRRRPNENYARELMELFTIGIGNYSEEDIREASRALTGWTVRNDRFFDNVANHDGGAKSFLGHSGNLNGYDICRIVASHPACAPFIARKLIQFLVTDTPETGFVERSAATFRSSGLDLRALVRSILLSAEFRAEAARRALIKSPCEYVIGLMKDLGIATLTTTFPVLLRQMQQTLFNPPGVEGWPGGSSWLSSTTFLHRANFAKRLTSDRPASGQPPYLDPFAYLEGRTDNRAIVDFLVDRLLDGAMADAGRGLLVEWLDGGSARGRARRLRGCIHLVLTSSVYQMN